MAEPENRLAQLEAKVAELAEQNHRLLNFVKGQTPSAAPTDAATGPASEDGASAVDRRVAMRRLGTAAAAAVGLVAANGAFRPAAADDGDFMQVGTIYTGSSTTGVEIDAGGTSLQGSVAGTSGGIGVLGEASGTSLSIGYGVQGQSASAFGAGAAVQGRNTGGGIGVHGLSRDAGGIGVYAEGGDSHVDYPGTGLLARSAYGTPLRLSSTSVSDVPPTSGSWTAGSFLVKNGALWYCITSGTGSASEWVRLSGAFVPLDSPTRAYDSREGDGKLARGETRDIDVAAAVSDIPASASAVLLNATVANTVNSGFLTLYPQGASVPDTASLNYTGPGQIVGNNATVGLTGGLLTAKLDGGSTSKPNSVDVILDAYGYYA